jgi:pimeloyl-ACP methyl ester carboxylesterase
MLIAQLLAVLALQSYGDASTAKLPDGFQAASLAGVETSEGRFTKGSATALVARTRLDGAPTLVVTFRGSDGAQDWRTDLRDINLAYAKFQPLVRAIDSYAPTGGRVLLVGHSQGGAVVQIFMYAHRGQDRYRAVTFGSPGARPQQGLFAAATDPRITNYAVSDDPFVFLAGHRAEVVSYAIRHPIYGLMLAQGIAAESGLPLISVLLGARATSDNYLNNGQRVRIAGVRPSLTVRSMLRSDPTEHEPETYAKLLQSRFASAPALW